MIHNNDKCINISSSAYGTLPVPGFTAKVSLGGEGSLLYARIIYSVNSKNSQQRITPSIRVRNGEGDVSCGACGQERPNQRHCCELQVSSWGESYCYWYWEDCSPPITCPGDWKCDDGRCCAACRSETPWARCCRQVGRFKECKQA